MKDFVRSKFDPVIESSEALSAKVIKDPLSRRAVYSTVLKRIQNSYFFFRGSWSEHKAQTLDADILVVDELDFQKPGVRKMYEERLEGSSSKDIIYWIGTPTLPNYGISELYEDSDMREWHIKCSACEKIQVLEWPTNISFKKKTFICKFCRTDLTTEDRKKGAWIPRHPGREVHGYYFNRLMAPWISAEKIIESYHKDSPKHFHNFTLGLPYLEQTLRFKRDDFVNALMVDEEFDNFQKNKLVCGIDQGNHFHTILGYGNRFDAVTTKARMFNTTESLEEYLDTIKPDMIVMDRYPDQHYAKGLQDKYGGVRKFLLINQRTWVNPAKIHSFMDHDRPQGLVNLERTESLDRMMDRIKLSTLRFLKSMTGMEDLLTHLQNLLPDFEERFGRRKKVYKKIGKEDFAHALNYFLTGCEILFPESGSKAAGVIQASRILEREEGTKSWFEQEMERRMNGISRAGGGQIHIPPNNF